MLIAIRGDIYPTLENLIDFQEAENYPPPDYISNLKLRRIHYDRNCKTRFSRYVESMR